MNMSLLISSEKKLCQTYERPENVSTYNQHTSQHSPSSLLHLLSPSTELESGKAEMTQTSERSTLTALMLPPVTDTARIEAPCSAETPSQPCNGSQMTFPCAASNRDQKLCHSHFAGSPLTLTAPDNGQLQNIEPWTSTNRELQIVQLRSSGDTPSTAISSTASSTTAPSTPVARMSSSPSLFLAPLSSEHQKGIIRKETASHVRSCSKSPSKRAAEHQRPGLFSVPHHTKNIQDHRDQKEHLTMILSSLSSTQNNSSIPTGKCLQSSGVEAGANFQGEVLGGNRSCRAVSFRQTGLSSGMCVDDDRDARLEKAVSMVLSRRYSVRKAAQAFRLPKSTVHRYLQATRGPSSISGVFKPLRRIDQHSISLVPDNRPKKCDISFLIDSRYDQ